MKRNDMIQANAKKRYKLKYALEEEWRVESFDFSNCEAKSRDEG
jgi:hypothetical protein